MLSTLALVELLLMHGHLRSDEDTLQALLDIYGPVQHAAEARYEPGHRKAREELAAASLCEGALLRRAASDDARCEDLLHKAVSLGAPRGLDDPFHRPFAHYELGLLHRRNGDLDRALDHLRRARDAPPGFSCDRMLSARAQCPLEAILRARGDPAKRPTPERDAPAPAPAVDDAEAPSPPRAAFVGTPPKDDAAAADDGPPPAEDAAASEEEEEEEDDDDGNVTTYASV